MNSAVLNRIIVVLSWAGVFVAGLLTAAHFMGVTVPCGIRGGCEIVTQSSASKLFGIPVSLFGLLGYILITVLACLRMFSSKVNTRLLSVAGLTLSTIGISVSVVLLNYAFGKLHATCYWCVASGVLMALLFVAHVALIQVIEKPTNNVFRDQVLFVACMVLSMGSIVGGLYLKQESIQSQKYGIRSLKSLQAHDLIKDERYFQGPVNAPITIIEFSDFYCPLCRTTYPHLKKLYSEHPGKIRLGYKHFPLYEQSGHNLSIPAAMGAEFAGEHGRFWEYVDLVMTSAQQRIGTLEGLYAIVSQLGLDPGDLERRLKDMDPKLFDKVANERTEAISMGIRATPTFIVIAKGLPTNAALNDAELKAIISRPEYQHLLK